MLHCSSICGVPRDVAQSIYLDGHAMRRLEASLVHVTEVAAAEQVFLREADATVLDEPLRPGHWTLELDLPGQMV